MYFIWMEFENHYARIYFDRTDISIEYKDCICETADFFSYSTILKINCHIIMIYITMHLQEDVPLYSDQLKQFSRFVRI